MSSPDPHDETNKDELLVQAFLKYWLVQNKSPDTAKNSAYTLRAFSRFLHDRGKTIVTAARDDVKSYLASLRSRRQDRAIARVLSAIRSIYQWLLIRAQVKSDPTEGVRIPRTWVSEPNPLPEPVVEEMIHTGVIAVSDVEMTRVQRSGA